MIPGRRPQKGLLAKTSEGSRRQAGEGRGGEGPRRQQEVRVQGFSVYLWVSSLEITVREHLSFIGDPGLWSRRLGTRNNGCLEMSSWTRPFPAFA